MRISDWSSDVCSSDLVLLPQPRHRRGRRGQPDRRRLLQAGLPRAADGVRGGGEDVAGSQPGRLGRMMRYLLRPCWLVGLCFVAAACDDGTPEAPPAAAPAHGPSAVHGEPTAPPTQTLKSVVSAQDVSLHVDTGVCRTL